jgi:hypothetical protein
VTVTVTVNGSVTVNLHGTGTGTVVSDDGRIDCTSGSSSGCVATYTTAALVNLHATAATGSVFAGWGSAAFGGPPFGDCNTSASNCFVTASGNRHAAAKFDIATFTLAVTASGGGAIRSDAGAIDCGHSCSDSFVYGTPVILTATPDPGHELDTWSGACAGVGPSATCSVVMDADKLAAATFKPVTLTSFAIAPSAAMLGVGRILAFTAQGTFSDGSSRALAPGSALEAADQFGCARLLDGTVRCWGGPAGAAPSLVPGVGAAVALAAGDSHGCAALADGTVKCWGRGTEGQLGDGGFASSATAVAVAGVSSAVAVAGGATHSCALLAGGAVACWGDNALGQLGDPAFPGSSSGTPVSVAGLSGAIAISAEGGQHTCAVLGDGGVRCWGGNASGQLGGTPASPGALVTVAGVKATAVAAGGSHTCALITDGSVKCWGDGPSGQLGDGTSSSSASPVAVSGIASASSIGAGDHHACAVVSGRAWCWGDNSYGQLGVSTVATAPTPVMASGGDALSVAAGSLNTCALLSTGAIECWGANSAGQVGYVTSSASSPLVAVTGISTAAAVGWGSGDAS